MRPMREWTKDWTRTTGALAAGGLLLIIWALLSPLLIPRVPVCDIAITCLTPQEGKLFFTDSGDGENWYFDESGGLKRTHNFIEYDELEDAEAAREGKQTALLWYGELVALERKGTRVDAEADFPERAFVLGVVLLGLGVWRRKVHRRQIEAA